MWRATLRSLGAHKSRLAMTALAIILGVGLMSGTLVLTDTVGRTFDDLVSDIYAETDAVIRSADSVDTGFGETLRAPLDEALVDELLTVGDVVAAEGFVQGFAQAVSVEGEAVGGGFAPTFGFGWITVEQLNPFVIVDGAPPSGPGEVVLDPSTAEEAGATVGDTITVLSSQEPAEFEVVGLARFGTIDRPGGASVLLFDLPVAQTLFDLEGQVSEIGVVAVDGMTQDDAVAAIGKVLPDGVEAITGEAKTAEDQQSFQQALGFINTFLLAFALVALFVGCFIIYNTFTIIVAQRSRELALLRAIGASRRQVLASLLGESVLVGLGASVIGALSGVGIALGLKAMLGGFGVELPTNGVVILPGSLLTAVLTGFVITVVVAVAPAVKASRVPPLAALRDVAIDRSSMSVARVVGGLLVIGLGALNLVAGLAAEGGNAAVGVGFGALCVFIGVAVLGPVIARPTTRLLAWPLPRLRGVTGNLARENAIRNPKRTASTAAALMIGVGLVGFITVTAASVQSSIDKILDDAVTGDLIISSGNFGMGGFSPELAAQVSEVDGVDAVSGFRFAFGSVDGQPAFVGSANVDVFEDIADPEVVEGDLRSLGVGEIAISTGKAEAHDLALGDTVEMSFASGVAPLTVGAIFENDIVAGDWLMDHSGIEAVEPGTVDLQVFVRFTDDADADEVVAVIEGLTASYANAELQDLTEYKESQSAMIDQLLNLIYALLLLAIVIALVGIANTLALSIHERTRELGLLRAVGMTRKQLTSTIRWESVVIAVYGTLLGLVIGTVFGWALVQALGSEGLEVFTLPVARLVLIVLIAAGAGVLASLLPAWRASRLDVLDAIQTE
ncbi:MAG: FtsX-like permease family protein [Acidimicrobiia bacterium]|nr:FtsX-like permease family protein [Acidimicrobiia bacterium]